MSVRYIFLLVLFTLFSISGCAGPIPKHLMEEISQNTDFGDVIRNPALAVGKKVLWGGEILETKTYSEYSLIEIIQKPLGFKERPLPTDASAGRFLVEYRGQFLDPAIYKAGREITIIGEIIRVEKKKLSEMNYRYPYVLASYVHLWSEQLKQARVLYPPPYYCDPFWRGCRYAFDPYYPEPYFYSDPFFRRPFGLWPYRTPYFFREHRHTTPMEKGK